MEVSRNGVVMLVALRIINLMLTSTLLAVSRRESMQSSESESYLTADQKHAVSRNQDSDHPS